MVIQLLGPVLLVYSGKVVVDALSRAKREEPKPAVAQTTETAQTDTAECQTTVNPDQSQVVVCKDGTRRYYYPSPNGNYTLIEKKGEIETTYDSESQCLQTADHGTGEHRVDCDGLTHIDDGQGKVQDLFAQGDLARVTTNPEGIVVAEYRSGPIALKTEYPDDGKQPLAMVIKYRDGRIEKMYRRGVKERETTYPKGHPSGYQAVIQYRSSTVKTEATYADGRRTLLLDGGSLETEYPNNVNVYFDSSDRTVQTEFPDGTSIIDYPDGRIVTINPDGSEETEMLEMGSSDIDPIGSGQISRDKSAQLEQTREDIREALEEFNPEPSPFSEEELDQDPRQEEKTGDDVVAAEDQKEIEELDAYAGKIGEAGTEEAGAAIVEDKQEISKEDIPAVKFESLQKDKSFLDITL